MDRLPGPCQAATTASLMMTDAFIVEALKPGDFFRVCVHMVSAIAVVVTGRLLPQQ